MLTIDWRAMFVPSGSLVELVIRGSVMYLLILAGFRIFRRDAGSLGVSDLLVIVLIADAAQNGMAGEYRSLTEAAVLVGTIFGWNVCLDWLAYHYPTMHWLLHPPRLLLIRHGRIHGRNLHSQMLTREDLMEQLREQGVDDVRSVRQCSLESDGHLSVIKYESGDEKKGEQSPSSRRPAS
jgi:uncharacterized membrane protein YcaP (DUF421 family)